MSDFKLVVFDLDFTLWNAGGTWVDHTNPPFRKVNAHVCDASNSVIYLYPDSGDLLRSLSQKYDLAVASRTHQPSWALRLMELFDIKDYFSHTEIFPGSKTDHFINLKKKTGFQFSEMIFFDDEWRNISDVARLGVTAVLVEDGISTKLVNENLG